MDMTQEELHCVFLYIKQLPALRAATTVMFEFSHAQAVQAFLIASKRKLSSASGIVRILQRIDHYPIIPYNTWNVEHLRAELIKHPLACELIKKKLDIGQILDQA